MIYASLPTIRAWNQPLVAPVYLVLALATGGVLLILLLAIFGYGIRWAAIATALALAARSDPEAALLVRDRHRGENLHRGGRHRAWPISARSGRSIRRTPSRTS